MTLNRHKTNKHQFVDLIIAPSKPGLTKKLAGNYRLCTLTKTNSGQRLINLRLPDSVQDTILDAYKEGKTVRIFA